MVHRFSDDSFSTVMDKACAAVGMGSIIEFKAGEAVRAGNDEN